MTTSAKEALQTIGKVTAKQVKRETGLFYHHNLDPISFTALQEAASNLKELGTPCSHSVVVRRALRLYAELTRKLSESQKVEEGYQLLRASKGT